VHLPWFIDGGWFNITTFVVAFAIAGYKCSRNKHNFISAETGRNIVHGIAIFPLLMPALSVFSNEILKVLLDSDRLIPWPEIIAKAPETARNCTGPFRFTVAAPQPMAIIPDAPFGIEYRSDGKRAYRIFALEADRGTMPIVRSAKHQTSYLGKLAGHREIITGSAHKANVGIPNLLVLTVTTNEERMRTILRRLEERPEGSAAFLFKAVGPTRLTTLVNQLLSDSWLRAGLSPLRIDA
jgi:hypothetical protein